MNATPNTNTVDAVDVQNFYYDEEGNRIEIPFDVTFDDGKTYSGSETAPAETTVFVAEDSADHPVTVH